MGDSERMGQTGSSIILYSGQTDQVCEIIKRDGVCYSRPSYVEKKYGESAAIFRTAYDFYVKEAKKIVPCPQDAEYPYWAFKDRDSVEYPDGRVLTLKVPLDEVVLFDMYDWTKILQFQYIGRTDADTRAFKEELAARGIREYDVMLGRFYEEQKQQILNSWKQIFRHHETIKNGIVPEGIRVQVGLWRISREWIV